VAIHQWTPRKGVNNANEMKVPKNPTASERALHDHSEPLKGSKRPNDESRINSFSAGKICRSTRTAT
jgi:hypothetical protein